MGAKDVVLGWLGAPAPQPVARGEAQTRFAIIFVGRQGSSYLQGLLNAHPDARCEGEILSAGGPFAPSGHSDVEAFLREYLHAGPEMAAGFKMPWMSFEQYPDTWEVFERLNYRLVHITRNNKLDQYISIKLASINQAWRSDFGTYEKQCFTGDIQEAEAYFKTLRFQDAMLRQAARTFPTIEVSYEALTEDRGYDRVLEFLDLERVPLESPFRKQRAGRQRDVLENFDEMKRHFAGTEWGVHFQG